MNNRWYSLLTAVIIPTLFLSACATRKVAASELERALNPNVPATDVEQLVKGNTTLIKPVLNKKKTADLILTVFHFLWFHQFLQPRMM
jgi:hypothetical protein